MTAAVRTQAARHALAHVVACALMFACILFATPAAAAESEATVAERRIKAAFLVKFVEYVEWPADAFAGPDAPLVIGVLGEPAMLQELQKIVANRRFHDRPFEVREVAPDAPARTLHVLFVGRDKVPVSEHVVAPTQAVLVVTDQPGGLPAHATLNFVVSDARVQFEASIDDAEQRRLKLGSGLLSVARNTRRSGS